MCDRCLTDMARDSGMPPEMMGQISRTLGQQAGQARAAHRSAVQYVWLYRALIVWFCFAVSMPGTGPYEVAADAACALLLAHSGWQLHRWTGRARAADLARQALTTVERDAMTAEHRLRDQ